MRSPEVHNGGRRMEGQHFQNEYLHYLKPESFRVLPSDGRAIPSPPKAPEPYKLTPRKRHKNQSFAIIAEPGLSSQTSSRSTSPTGRLSPFRGRGFNPTGSRHASPAPSPPPADRTAAAAERLPPRTPSSISKSQIPILKPYARVQRSVEDLLSSETSPSDSPNKTNLQTNARYSKSLGNIVPRNVTRKPPVSPRRSTLKPSFLRLSPIIGSSPEAGSDRLESSPHHNKGNLRSRSQPPSRIVSPAKRQSRPGTRETSPSESPSKIPKKTSAYKNIPAKVDTFQRVAQSVKPKVPNKPKVYSTRTIVERATTKSNSRKTSVRTPKRETDETETTDTDREPIRRRGSISNSIRNPPSSVKRQPPSRTRHDSEKSTSSKSYSTSKKSSADSNGKSNHPKEEKEETQEKTTKVGNRSRTNSQTFRKEESSAKDVKSKQTTTSVTTTEDSKTDEEKTEEEKDDDILSVTIDEMIGSQTTKIVSATAETVVKPLNIEAKLMKQSDLESPVKPTSNNQEPPLSKQEEQTTTTVSNGSIVSTPVNNPPNHQNGTPPMKSTPEAVNNLKQVTTSSNNFDMNTKNNFNNLTPPDTDKVQKSLMDASPVNNLTAQQKMKQARTVIVDEIKPIKITVREKSGDVKVQSGNFALPRSATNGISERPMLPPPNQPPNQSESPNKETTKPKPYSKLLSCFKKTPKEAPPEDAISAVHHLEVPQSEPENEKEQPVKCWDKMCCKGPKGRKIGDAKSSGFFSKLRRKKNEENWAERRDSILSEPPKRAPISMTLRKIFCTPCSKCKKKPEMESVSRRPSMMSKKKSLSSTMQPLPEKKGNNTVVKDTGPKLDASLVEHSSHMRGAIPVLPVPLAWFCLMCNVFLPGVGTILSGLFCLCIGKPRFSPRDSAKARFGAFLIDIIVGISQMFTVLFCLVGWGWSIWWGIIMLKIARKNKKIELAEKRQIEEQPVPSVNVNHEQRDVERGH